MSKFYVERQYWQRWPRVLLMCKDTGNGIERRRYVPEGGTVEEWKKRVRDVLQLERNARSDYEQAMATLQGEFARAENLQAEIDGLQWAVEERDELIRDMWKELKHFDDAAVPGTFGTLRLTSREHFAERMREMGVTP